MDNAPSTLFYLFENDLLPAPGGQTAFLNAQFHPALESLKKNTLALQQHFKPDAQDLQQRGFSVSSAINLPAESQDHVMLLVPKNAVESLGLIAQALVMLKPGGTIICAGDNKAGGARLKNNLQLFGLKNIQEESKNKARVAWATKENLNQNEIDHALKAGAMQFVLDESFVSMPGIFGWDKIDKGSDILTRHLPDDFKGAGADFGCGYGFLSSHVLRHANAINAFICVDADFRSLRAAQENLKSLGFSALKFLWEDLTAPVSTLHDLDFIVMNPPFHEGKGTDISIGRAFIKTAAQSLRHGGQLWMVANSQLPYEAVLDEFFESLQKTFEAEGFKIFNAKK